MFFALFVTLFLFTSQIAAVEAHAALTEPGNYADGLWRKVRVYVLLFSQLYYSYL
jgi:hypothetical protein